MSESNLNSVNDNLGILSKQAIEIETLKQENAKLKEDNLLLRKENNYYRGRGLFGEYAENLKKLRSLVERAKPYVRDSYYEQDTERDQWLKDAEGANSV